MDKLELVEVSLGTERNPALEVSPDIVRNQESEEVISLAMEYSLVLVVVTELNK